MNGPAACELKHDTASVRSMDSAYQSQSDSSRGGTTMPEGYQSLAPQDPRSRMGSQFLGSDAFSPNLGSENFTAFPEHHPEMSHMQLPSAAGDLEAGENSFVYANFTTGQDFSQFTTTSMPRFSPASGIDMTGYWGTTEHQPFAPFNFSPYPKSANSMDAALYPNQDPPELMFNAPTSLQRHSIAGPRLDTSVRPQAVRRSTSFMTNQHGLRRLSTTEPAYAGFVMSPTSAVSTHVPSGAPSEYEHRQLESRVEKEEPASGSPVTHSVADEDEPLSPQDAAAAQNIEEEQGKIARSHPLYQKLPDENGKYHCPSEGKPGCTHKPTTLKCNYDKYVDSHLKPFRCNKKVCVGLQFSSTACLLRHEREAHGMHAHGIRPHRCHFPDCERSVVGNGFPRRYNLYDHMRRVHDFTGPAAETTPAGQPSQTGGPRKGAKAKRKSTADDGGEKRAKVPKLTAQQQQQQRRVQLEQDFLNKKQDIINILTSLSGPTDLGDKYGDLTKEVLGLHQISDDFKKSIGG